MDFLDSIKHRIIFAFYEIHANLALQQYACSCFLVSSFAVFEQTHFIPNFAIHTVGEEKNSTKHYLWSKTILTTGSVGGPWVDPPLRKINKFFLRSLALSVPTYRHFQSNGANWRSIKR